MIDIIVYACLLADPPDCERRITTVEGHLPSCIVLLPATEAAWSREHPRWELQYMRCRHHRKEA